VLLQVRERTPLTAEQASGIVTATLQGSGPAIIHFRAGLVKPSAMRSRATPIISYWKKRGLLNWPRRLRGVWWSRSHLEESA
jgi:hypothetical protein